MIRFDLRTRIDRPVAEVFAYVTDPAKLPEWQTNTVEVSLQTAGPIGVGTRLREVHRGLGRRLESVVEVSSYEPERSFALRVVSGPLPIDGRWTFEPAAGGGTRLELTAEGHAPGLLRIAEPLIALVVRRRFAGFHRRLKEALEAPP